MPMLCRDHTRGVSKHTLAVFECGGCRLPATRAPRGEKVLRVRSSVPDGDRRHGTESGGIENEVAICGKFEHHVVGVFVLRDDLERRARGRERSAPSQYVGQSALLTQRADDRVVEHRPAFVANRYVSHGGLPGESWSGSLTIGFSGVARN